LVIVLLWDWARTLGEAFRVEGVAKALNAWTAIWTAIMSTLIGKSRLNGAEEAN